MNEKNIFLLLTTAPPNNGLGVAVNVLPQRNIISFCNPEYISSHTGVNSMFMENQTNLYHHLSLYNPNYISSDPGVTIFTGNQTNVYNPIVSDPQIITTNQKMEIVSNIDPQISNIDNASDFSMVHSNSSNIDVVAPESTVAIADDSPHTVKIKSCTMCSKTFSNTSKLNRHLAVHSNKRPYSCQLCSKTFKLPNYLKVHMVCHINKEAQRDVATTSEPRIIAIQGPKVDHESNLNPTAPKLSKNSLSKVTAKVINGAYYCSVCNNDYPDRFMFKSHLKFHQDQPCNSEIDSKSFQQHRQLKKHNNIVISKKNKESLLKVYPCTICYKVFRTTKELNRHSKTHNKESVFCSICGLDCKFKSQLKRHMIVHDKSNRIEYVCDICGKSVTSLKSLKEHKLWHKGDKPHQCEECGKCFVKRTTLTVHMRSHTGVKPYKCKLCDKSFTQRPTLNIHMRYHTGERPYACDICSNAFVSRSLLNMHKRSKHQLMP